MSVLVGYTITSQLHTGSDSVVCRAVRERDQQRVVIKLTRSDSPSPRALASLQHEYELLQQIDLPGVIRVYALERCGNGLALIMQDSGSRSVHELAAERRLDLSTVLHIAIAVADTLHGLHRIPVLHKDLKPHKATTERKRLRNDPQRCEVLAN